MLNGTNEHPVLGRARASFQNPAKAFENRRSLGGAGAVAAAKASMQGNKPRTSSGVGFQGV